MHKTFGYTSAYLHQYHQNLLRRLRREDGQGTVEYVGIVLVVAVLMGVVVVAMKGIGADSLTKAIFDQVEGAIKNIKF